MTLNFIESIPRSGSTLLTSLLNQRPDTYASNTSNLCDMIYAFNCLWETNTANLVAKRDGLTEEECILLLQKQRYSKINKPIIFDKGRGWSGLIDIMSKVQNEIKIVATVRPINECISSLIKLAKPDNISQFLSLKNGFVQQQLLSSYNELKKDYEKYPDKFLLIEYSDLVNHTQKQMDRISDFIGADKFIHDLDNVPPSTEEDRIWGITDLHKIRSKVAKQEYSQKELLGDYLWEYYSGGEFWNDKPEPVRKSGLLDIQLEAGIHGDFEKGWEIAQQLEEKTPADDRAAFNRGWYLLEQGKLLEGHILFDRGRFQNVFGNQHIGSSQPIWKKGNKGVILLNMEGGLGDQINSYRYAFDLQELGNRVVISCSPELAKIFVDKFTVVEPRASCGVYHDYWLPSMSSVVAFDYEYEDLKGTPYISRTAEIIPGRIGVRWSGNPKFEHEQHRFFPANYMFDAVRGYDCVSLQRDKDAELRPMWMPQANVDDWQDTRKSISQCELVITSCTSVAHLSAAMGINTWIVIPVLPYYVWALPGNKSPYYDSVTLFRQEKYEDWSHPFENIKKDLLKYK